MTPFVVFATQRSGSTWLVDLLDSHGQVVCYSELFLDDGRGHPTWGGAKDMPFWATWLSMTGGSLEEYLDQVFQSRPGVVAAGLKLMYGQSGAHPEILREVSSRAGVVVHLTRRNTLDVVISRLVAYSRDLYHVSTADPRPHEPVTIDVGALVSQIDQMQHEIRQANRRLERLGVDVVDVAYEDLVTDVAHLDRVLTSLGARPRPLLSRLRKVVRAPREETVSNYEDVRAALATTPYAWMLDDEPAGMPR